MNALRTLSQFEIFLGTLYPHETPNATESPIPSISEDVAHANDKRQKYRRRNRIALTFKVLFDIVNVRGWNCISIHPVLSAQQQQEQDMDDLSASDRDELQNCYYLVIQRPADSVTVPAPTPTQEGENATQKANKTLYKVMPVATSERLSLARLKILVDRASIIERQQIQEQQPQHFSLDEYQIDNGLIFAFMEGETSVVYYRVEPGLVPPIVSEGELDDDGEPTSVAAQFDDMDRGHAKYLKQ